MTDVFMRERRRLYEQRPREEGHMKAEAEIGGQPQAKEHQVSPASIRREAWNKFSRELSEGTSPAHTLSSDV